MIKSFKHKGLRRLFEKGKSDGVDSRHVKILRLLLARLHQAKIPADMNLPGRGLHPLKGKRKGFWSVWISGNWRLIFRFESGDAYDLDYLDYH